MPEVLSFGQQRDLLSQAKKSYDGTLDRLELCIRQQAFKLIDSGNFCEAKNPEMWKLATDGHIPSVFLAVRDILWKGVLEIIFETLLDDGSEIIKSQTGRAKISFERRELLKLIDEELIRAATEYELALEGYAHAQAQQTSILESIKLNRPPLLNDQWSFNGQKQTGSPAKL